MQGTSRGMWLGDTVGQEVPWDSPELKGAGLAGLHSRCPGGEVWGLEPGSPETSAVCRPLLSP